MSGLRVPNIRSSRRRLLLAAWLCFALSLAATAEESRDGRVSAASTIRAQVRLVSVQPVVAPPNGRHRDLAVRIRVTNQDDAALQFGFVQAVFREDGRALCSSVHLRVRRKPGLPAGIGGLYFPGDAPLGSYRGPRPAESFSIAPGATLDLDFQSSGTQLATTSTGARELVVTLATLDRVPIASFTLAI